VENDAEVSNRLIHKVIKTRMLYLNVYEQQRILRSIHHSTTNILSQYLLRMKKYFTLIIPLLLFANTAFAYDITGTLAGRVRGSDTDWSTAACTGGGCTSGDYVDAVSTIQTISNTSPYRNYRPLIHFDLTGVTTSSVSAVLTLTGTGSCSSAGSTLYITSAAPADWTSLVNSDYANFDNTILSNGINESAWNCTGGNSFTLNSDGLNFINSLQGTSATLSMRLLVDINATGSPSTDQREISAATLSLTYASAGGGSSSTPSSTASSTTDLEQAQIDTLQLTFALLAFALFATTAYFTYRIIRKK